MALSWNEIKDRALNFSKEWADTSNEEADAKPFLVEFFNVFGISSKRVGTFEHRVKKLDDKDGYIDLLWKGTILIEMKSRGKNLDRAYQQAIDYTHGLKQHELPKYILISDFENFRLFDLEEDKHIEFKLNDLVNNVQHFGYILGYQKKVYKEQDPANIKAAELMGKLHDRLKEIGYTGHPLEVYLVRILFLLFAEDTTIFNKQQFQDYVDQRSNEDGSDLAFLAFVLVGTFENVVVYFVIEGTQLGQPDFCIGVDGISVAFNSIRCIRRSNLCGINQAGTHGHLYRITVRDGDAQPVSFCDRTSYRRKGHGEYSSDNQVFHDGVSYKVSVGRFMSIVASWAACLRMKSEIKISCKQVSGKSWRYKVK